MVSSSRADAQRTQHLLHSTLVLSHYLRGYRPVKSERRFCVSGHLWLEAHRRLGTLAAILFRWRDSAHHNEHKLLTVSLDEFLRRFLLHVLPKGFVRIRHFGFLADRCRLRSNGFIERAPEHLAQLRFFVETRVR